MNDNTNGLFPARITRASYLTRGILLLMGAFMAAGMLSLSDGAPLVVKIVLIASGATAVLCLGIALFCSILIPRLRDVGLHPAWSLLILVHSLDFLFLLGLLLLPSNAFAKRSYSMR